MTHSKVEFDILNQLKVEFDILNQLLDSIRISYQKLEADVSYIQRHEHRSKEVEEKIHNLSIAVDNIFRETSKAHDCVRILRELLLND